MSKQIGGFALAVALALAAGGAPASAAAQDTSLDALLAAALAANPELRAERARVDAAQARIGPAGTRPDPMLSVGLMNLPATEPGFDDFMTMAVVGVGQALPYPGKLALARRAAELELQAAKLRLTAAELGLVADARKDYYELAYLDRALVVLEQQQQLLVTVLAAAEARYVAGTGTQPDVLRARLETARLAQEAVAAAEQRTAALARLNARLDRPSDAPIPAPILPERVRRAATPAEPARVTFASTALGARATGSPFPPLVELQERALAGNPMLQAHEAEIAARAARLELARKAHLPDLEVSVQYGLRPNHNDMIGFMVSAPLPLRRASRQDQQVAETQAELAALEAEHRAMVNRLRAEVATAHAQLERDRAQLALLAAALVPQGRATLESTTAAFQVGRSELPALLEAQATLYDLEISYVRVLADFAASLAALERVLGSEVLP